MQKVFFEMFGKYVARTVIIGGIGGGIDGLTNGIFTQIPHRDLCVYNCQCDYYKNDPDRGPPRIRMAMERGAYCALRGPIVIPAILGVFTYRMFQ